MDSRDRFSRISESGGVGVPLEDYWKEFSSFDDTGQPDEDEEDLSKTPDEGEAEEEWLREAGFETLVDCEMTEQDEAEFYEDILATLTARQIAVVKKRLDTVQMSKKRRVPRSRPRADVRDVFSQASTSPPQSLTTIHSEPPSLNYSLGSRSLSTSLPVNRDRWSSKLTDLPRNGSEEQSSVNQSHSKPNNRGLPLPFLRTGHSGGFSLRGHAGMRAIDCESPTSVEVLRYETRKSVIHDKEISKSTSDLNSINSSESFPLETGFQEISSKLNSVGDLVDPDKDLASLQRNSNVQIRDLSENDRNLVRSLAIIEVAALLDTHGLVPTRRRKPNRKKGKDNVVFGASINSLLEMDRRRCPGLKVPLIYQWILHHLHSNGLREEGLMRLAGSAQKIQALKTEIERSYATSPNLVENLIRQSSAIDVSVILKQLVRHLPEPLLTNSHMDAFLQVPNIPNIQDQVNALNLLVLALPDGHRELLQEILYFLSKVVAEEDANRMSLGNVAMIIAPNLFPPPRLKKGNHKNDLAAEVTVAAMSSKVTQLLIKFGSFLGNVPPELLAQARLQNRRSANKHAKRAVRKLKGEKQKNIKDDNIHVNTSIIRVQFSSLRHPNSITVNVTDRTTAGEVIEKVAEALEHMVDPRYHSASVDQQENRAFLQRPRTTSEPIVMRHRCLMGSKKTGEYLKDHYLYYIRENVGDRRLDHGLNIFAIIGSVSGRFTPGTTWEIRCHHS
ncbi:rho GTPase-activating protein 18-like [Uloborus diversus]|uniref:rho GTPase-activating protein 18-like n=1 Tax=Uloborus diversus TaxID=327109 RepID=UPI0024099FC1|nr:rho GTPase-activating protein 18-like [Uloborus diversus]